ETQLIMYDEIIDLVTDAIMADMKSYDAQAIQLSDWKVPTEAKIPSGEVEKRVELARHGRDTGNISFQVLFLREGRVCADVWGSVCVDVMVDIIKLATSINRGGLVQAGD